METGGIGGKLGGDYELHRVAELLIDLAAGGVERLWYEPAGAAGAGVDVEVAESGGRVVREQCKRQNGLAGKWGIRDLARAGVLDAAAAHAGGPGDVAFRFTSGDNAPALRDLAGRARRSADPVSFRDEKLSAELAKALEQLGDCWVLDAREPADLQTIWSRLRRMEFLTIDPEDARARVEDKADRWLEGDPRAAAAALKDLLVGELMGRPLDSPAADEALRRIGHPVRALDRPPVVREALRDCLDGFLDSFRHLLIGAAPLGRQESADILRQLDEPDARRLLLLHGPGGVGKTGVAYEVALALRARGVPCLPVRLDRDAPPRDLRAYGASLGLPGSPVACLSAAADGGPGVLILDQADALRWTAAHRGEAMEACGRLVDQALRTPNLRVVLACRTFDLEDDPRLRHWREGWRDGGRAAEVAVRPLPAAVLDGVLAALGTAPASLDAGRRALLAVPLNLSIFADLSRGGPPPAFRTAADLMRAYWTRLRTRQEPFESLPPGEYAELLDGLLDYADRNATVAVPASVASPRDAEAKALQSAGVLLRQGARFVFAHQAHADYLIAERLLREIHRGGRSVPDWLRGHDQSLFRRGQLRQVLALLRDEDPAEHARTLAALIDDPGIRFHLKHLALQSLSHADPPSPAEAELVVRLAEDAASREHVRVNVLAGKVPWFDALTARGTLRGWLDGEDRELASIALNSMRWAVDARGDAVADLLRLGGPDHKPSAWLASLLSWAKPELLCDRLFPAYAALVARGSPAVFHIDWKKAAAERPRRAIRLLRAWGRQRLRGHRNRLLRGEEPEKDRPELRDSKDVAAMVEAARRSPEVALRELLPIYRLLCGVERSPRRPRTPDGRLAPPPWQALRDLRADRAPIRRVLTAAAKRLARRRPERLLQLLGADVADKHAARGVDRLIAAALAAGPDEWADRALDWLLGTPRRLTCGTHSRGNRYRGGLYRPARRLLTRFGGVLGDSQVRRVERVIRRHRPKYEVDWFRRMHPYIVGKSGSGSVFRIEERLMFVGQYLLLSALPPARLSAAGQDWAGVLGRKFGPAESLNRWVGTSGSRSGKSALPRDRLHLISDSNWRRIISRDWSGRAKHVQFGPDTLGEVRPGTFAADLREMAGREPERFAAFARTLPTDADMTYVRAIFTGLCGALRSQGNSRGAGEGAAPPPEADPNAIEAVWHRFGLFADPQCASDLCWEVSHRPAAGWSDGMLREVVRVATDHADPPPLATTDGEDEADTGAWDLSNRALNCARGVAAHAVGSLLFDRPDRLPLLEPAIDSLVADAHPVVRVGALGVAPPMLNVDRRRAVDLFLAASDHPDPRVPDGNRVDEFFEWTLGIPEERARLRPVLERMLASPSPGAAGRAAAWVTNVWCFDGGLSDLADRVFAGPPAWRRAAAEAMANNAGRERVAVGWPARLALLFDDENLEVRRAASFALSAEGFCGRGDAESVMRAFAGSRAFDDGIDHLLRGMLDATGSLLDFSEVVFDVVRRITGELAAASRDVQTRRPVDADDLAKVLLRLYGESDDGPPLRSKCLDAWDAMLRERVGYDLLRALGE